MQVNRYHSSDKYNLDAYTFNAHDLMTMVFWGITIHYQKDDFSRKKFLSKIKKYNNTEQQCQIHMIAVNNKKQKLHHWVEYAVQPICQSCQLEEPSHE